MGQARQLHRLAYFGNVFLTAFWDPEGWSQKATLVVVLAVVVVISSLRVQKNLQGFLNMQRSATKLCVHIHAVIAHRSTVSDFSLIFALMSN